MPDLNTSYARQYTVVSKGPSYVVLRVSDDSLYHAYWQEFLGAEIVPESRPDASPMYLRIEQVPPEIEMVDQYGAFTPELPLVRLEVDGKSFNVTQNVTSNSPNTEVPGLYRVDYRIDLNGTISSVFWESYVSIQQRPLLRKAASGWAREGYAIKTLNRLVLEPQFMEALHAAGEPIYGFMQANQHPSIRAGLLSKYAGVRIWGVPLSGEQCIFIAGPQLPQGSVVVYNQRMLHLLEPVFADAVGSMRHMNPETHIRPKTSYSAGAVVRQGKNSYICIADAPKSTSLDNEAYWAKGHLYRFSNLSGEAVILPSGPLPPRQGALEHVWASVDDMGYPFWVDLLKIRSLGQYRGHYDKKSFADYGPGDIVSYVSENAIRLFVRKATDIPAESTLIYPPGNYRNPAWEEVYYHDPSDSNPLMSDYAVVPHTNAANAILSKTWCVSDEACTAYAHLVGIPQAIVDECGPKWSALLFALLTRTRNTFDGLRICMRAVGLDVKNLTLSDPAYSCTWSEDGTESAISDIYEQHEKLRSLVASIHTLEPNGQFKETPGALRYDPDNPGAIQQFEDGKWITKYSIDAISPAHIHNNRYFDCDVDVLARLAADAVKDLGDKRPWIKATAWAGEYSRLLADIVAYEIPIYVYVRLHILLYDESKIELESTTYSGILDGQACGCKNALELFPSYVFNNTAHAFVKIPTGVFQYNGQDWIEINPSKYNSEKDTYTYEFDTAPEHIRVAVRETSGLSFAHYWASPYTTGLLGTPSADGTLIPATNPEVTDESELVLINGYVGVTPVYRYKAVSCKGASAKTWQYVLNEPSAEKHWTLSGTTPFADWGAIATTPIIPFENTVDALKSATAYVHANSNSGATLPFEWDGDTLEINGDIPKTLFLSDASDNPLACIAIRSGRYTLSEQDCRNIPDAADIPMIRLPFVYG